MIYKHPPKDFVKEIDVVGCYIEHDGKFVLLHRHAHKTNGNKFGLPAGKIEKGEAPAEAMNREIWEETGLTIPDKNLKYFSSVFVRHEGHDIIYHMFSTRLPEKREIQINPKEHQGFTWVTPEDSLEMDLIHDQDECIRLFYQL